MGVTCDEDETPFEFNFSLDSDDVDPVGSRVMVNAINNNPLRFKHIVNKIGN
jgi:hypothetical protein